MMEGVFYFWCGDKLNSINLNMYINYVNSLSKSNFSAKLPSKKLDAKYLFSVPQRHAKFVIVEKGAIKILRRN